ncbi:hypothetical protein PTHTG4_27060 [Parageobacillus thermoglucosidasius]|nr:hypothetical protein PTHTG4_27060 [Parageobacillus thermoglucosidasius]
MATMPDTFYSQYPRCRTKVYAGCLARGDSWDSSCPNKQTARLLLEQVLAKWEEKAPKAMQILEEGFEDATAVLDYPDCYRRRLCTTNRVERLNEEIRRRERVILIFPNRKSVYRLVGAVLIEIDEKWMSGRKYLDMSEYWQWRKTKEQEARSVNQEVSTIKRVG